MDPAGLLPGDVLADVLQRLMPRSLAACRSVCKAWCATVDAHRLLRNDLLPLSLASIFVVYDNYLGYHFPPTFISRPSVGARIQWNPGCLQGDWSRITGHCNGLLLSWGGVANPATGQSACLPCYPYPTPIKGFVQRDFLVYDPTLSPHFEVFFMQCVCCRYGNRYENKAELVPGNPNSEWPPSPYVMSAFSSETWRWEERSFIRQGTAPRSIDPKLVPLMEEVRSGDAVYWRGRLYVYNIYFVIRLELEDNKYRVIQFPQINGACGSIMPHLGKSEKGVYYGFVHHDWCKLQIWFLNESTDHTEWMVKHEIDLKPLLEKFPWEHGDGSWFVQRVKDNKYETLDKEKPEWDSDDDDATIATTIEVPERFSYYSSNILGFHPYKEIVFLHMACTRVVAYHLSSSKVEDLGCLPLGDDDWIQSSVVYTPCWMESCLRAIV